MRVARSRIVRSKIARQVTDHPSRCHTGNMWQGFDALTFPPFHPLIELAQTHLHKYSIPGISLDAAGLVALAELSAISERTALTGSASISTFFS
jgi:hypothetical protein